MILTAISKPAASATEIDIAKAAAGFAARGALLIGTIHGSKWDELGASKKPPPR
jgi:hypothetical protein